MSDALGLAAEDAAVFGYGIVLAHADRSIVAAVRRQQTDHRARRDAAARLWTDAPSAPAGYTGPAVTTPDQALDLAIRLETDCCAAWRAQAATAEDAPRRRLCVDALTAASIQLAKWRTLRPGAGQEAFPGFPADF